MPPKVLENTLNIIAGIFPRGYGNRDTDPKRYSFKQYRYNSGKFLETYLKLLKESFLGVPCIQKDNQNVLSGNAISCYYSTSSCLILHVIIDI